MTQNIYTDPIARDEIEYSRKRLDHSWGVLESSRSIIDASREAIRASRALIRSLPERSIDAGEQDVLKNPLLAMDDEAISQFVDDLIAAYLEARASGTDADIDKIAKALKIVGSYLAAELGPKAAGVPLS